MNGADCGECGYITCQCARIKREEEAEKNDRVKQLEKQLKAKEISVTKLIQALYLITCSARWEQAFQIAKQALKEIANV